MQNFRSRQGERFSFLVMNPTEEDPIHEDEVSLTIEDIGEPVKHEDATFRCTVPVKTIFGWLILVYQEGGKCWFWRPCDPKIRSAIHFSTTTPRIEIVPYRHHVFVTDENGDEWIVTLVHPIRRNDFGDVDSMQRVRAEAKERGGGTTYVLE